MKKYGHRRHENFYSSCGGDVTELCRNCGVEIREWGDDYGTYIDIGKYNIRVTDQSLLYCKKISSML